MSGCPTCPAVEAADKAFEAAANRDTQLYKVYRSNPCDTTERAWEQANAEMAKRLDVYNAAVRADSRNRH